MEPVVRIGVVLADDWRNRVGFEVPDGAYSIADGDAPVPFRLPPRRPITASANSGRLSLDCDGNSWGGLSVVRLVPPANSPVMPGTGILVHGIAAGRGFHWRTATDQTLTGTLEFRAREGRVILVNELALEDYLTGVITAEMSGACPIEYLKAQAVTARSWVFSQFRRPHLCEPFTWCNDDCCQRYQGTGNWTDTAIAAIAATRGEVLVTSRGRICRACYSKNSGGISEDAKSVWGRHIPTLRAHFDGPPTAPERRFFPVTEDNARAYMTGDWLSETRLYAGPAAVAPEAAGRYLARVDDGNSRFRWKVDATQDDLRDSLLAFGLDDLGTVIDIEPLKRGQSGRLEEIALAYLSKTGERRRRRIGPEYNIRKALSPGFLFSSAFVVDLVRDARGVIRKATFHGAGWGHGVGLCQLGGLGRALAGQRYDQILRAYFDDVRLTRMYA